MGMWFQLQHVLPSIGALFGQLIDHNSPHVCSNLAPSRSKTSHVCVSNYALGVSLLLHRFDSLVKKFKGFIFQVILGHS